MRFRVVLVLTSLFCCAGLYASGPRPAADTSGTKPAAAESAKHYPDDGLLSNYRYANAFFGFSLDLPSDAGLRPVPSSNPTDGSIALLEVVGSSPGRCVVAISAYAAGLNGPSPRQLLRRELDDELTIGVEELHALSKTSIAGHQFFYYETRRGVDQHAIYATELDGYLLRFVTSGRDAKLLQQLEAAVTHMRFFPPESISEYIGVGAEPYNGPAIPYRLLEQLKSDPPARKLADGKVSGNVYENNFLGFGYELPRNWHYGTEAAIMPAVERSREHNFAGPAVSPSQRALLNACERTLVSAWRKMPQASGAIAYDDFGEVTISAMSLACFPNVKFPEAHEGKDAVTNFLVAYGLGHPILQDMRNARAFEHDGRTFLVMDGVVAYHEDGDALSRRVSVALAFTRQRGYLVTFFFAAPHESELHQLMNAKAAFDPDLPVKEVNASAAVSNAELQPGGSVAPVSAVAATSGASSNLPSSNAADAPPANSAPATKPQSDSATPAAEASDNNSFHPSLLKPGETMQDQQMEGSPIPGKSPKK